MALAPNYVLFFSEVRPPGGIAYKFGIRAGVRKYMLEVSTSSTTDIIMAV